MAVDEQLVRWFEDIDSNDVGSVGGKNASLGEMLQKLESQGIRVPGGFATTARAYRRFLGQNDGELEATIREHIERLADDGSNLSEVGEAVRGAILEAELPEELREAIRSAYHELSEREGVDNLDVAARSSATAEDLPEASFAGQQETYLNVTGDDAVLDACRACYASLFTDRAISYRVEQGFDHMEIALSVGVQRMVRSDLAGAGVMFSIDTETGFPDVVVINGSWGLGETVVGGTVTPDEYRVFKPLLDDDSLTPVLSRRLGAKERTIVYADSGGGTSQTVEITTDEEDRRRWVLTDREILTLARWAKAIEEHYDRPMDIEWAKDGRSDELFIVQARPETVQSQRAAATLKTYALHGSAPVLAEGLAVGSAIAAGPAFVLTDLEQAKRFEAGGVLVTGATDPDWEPIMEQAAAVVTDHGGRTSHAAIVSRELGVPAVIGTGDATDALDDGSTVTVSCAEGDTGRVYDGELEYEAKEIDPSQMPDTRTKVSMNMATPSAALRWWNLPADGIGLARMEFIINNIITTHPLAMARFDELGDSEVQQQIEALTAGWESPTDFFVDQLAWGIARIAASRYPDRVIVRLSDFKSNEYADLLGGRQFEPSEANPMLGFRGASRYDSERYRDGFTLECRAIRKVREEIGLTNVVVMVPFCRTPDEADGVLEVLADEGLERGANGFEVWVMAEIPSNIVLADEFAQRFDGFSIGTNDLTQLVLGVDRDSAELAHLFDARNPAVRSMIRDLIERAHAADLPVSLCGQAPSDHPDFATFLVEAGIDSISVNPDSVLDVRRKVAEAERGER